MTKFLSLIFVGAMMIIAQNSFAQSPLRTNVIKQFCVSKFAYSQRLQGECRKKQVDAVEAYKKFAEKAPLGSGLQKHLQQCLDDNFQGANGFDWETVVSCAGEYEDPPFEVEKPNTGPRLYTVPPEEDE